MPLCRLILVGLMLYWRVLRSFGFSGSIFKQHARLLSLRSSDDDSDVELASTKSSEVRHRIEWTTADAGVVEFTARDGETLRTAAFWSQLVSPHNGKANLINCRGLGTCGTCAVAVSGSVESPNAVEQVRLSVPPGHGKDTSPTLRLACQIEVRAPLNVTKFEGFWGQNVGDIAKKTLPTQPLGDLEFLLDNKSPSRDDDEDRP